MRIGLAIRRGAEALALHLALLTLPAPAALPASFIVQPEVPQMLGRKILALATVDASATLDASSQQTESPLRPSPRTAVLAAERAAQDREMAATAASRAEAVREEAAAVLRRAERREILEAYLAGKPDLASGYLIADVGGLTSTVSSAADESKALIRSAAAESDLVRLAAQQVGSRAPCQSSATHTSAAVGARL